ncbi:MAG TPA: hypothetical protein VEZ12_09860, partial [Herpetosiphonaceae bacterium]|nr:hypothetical protein [Herpetosiphonaceae bacterium]
MHVPRISLLMLVLLAACRTQPAVPTPVVERPTMQVATVTPASPTAVQPTPVPTTAPQQATETAAATLEATEPAGTIAPVVTDVPAATSAPIAIGVVDPITWTVPSGLKTGAPGVFASYRLDSPEVQPRNDAPPIAPDLSNVAVPFILSPAQKEALGQQGFVISPGDTREFFELYERARYNYE